MKVRPHRPIHAGRRTRTRQQILLVRKLGAHQVVDYRAARFEDVVDAVDVVFDTVGGEARHRSPAILSRDGRLVSIAADGEVTTNSKSERPTLSLNPFAND